MIKLSVTYTIAHPGAAEQSTLEKLRHCLVECAGAELKVEPDATGAHIKLDLSCESDASLQKALMCVGPLLTELGAYGSHGQPTCTENVPALLKTQLTPLKTEFVAV